MSFLGKATMQVHPLLAREVEDICLHLVCMDGVAVKEIELFSRDEIHIHPAVGDSMRLHREGDVVICSYGEGHADDD